MVVRAALVGIPAYGWTLDGRLQVSPTSRSLDRCLVISNGEALTVGQAELHC